MKRISLWVWTILIAAVVFAGASPAQADPGSAGQAAAQPIRLNQPDDADEPAADEPTPDAPPDRDVSETIPAPPDGDVPGKDDDIQDFLRALNNSPRPEFDPSDFRIAPGPPEPNGKAHRTSRPAQDEDQTPWPWRQAQLRPQEGLTRWLDFDAYDTGLPMLDYDMRHYPYRGATGRTSHVQMTRHHFATGIQYTGGMGIHGINTRINWLDLASDATLPDGRKLPSHLMDAQMEFFVPWFLPWSEFSVAFGSASDKPFASGDEMFVDITWLASPGLSEDGLLFLINFNTNREFLNGLPMGGFAYRYHDKKADDLKLVLGFPYSGLRWKATDRLQINAEYEFPRTVHTRIDYLCGRGVRLYGGFDWTNERFALHDRMEKDDRLFYYEKRLTAGVRWDIGEHIFIDASGGWAFDRFFFEGRGYQDRDDNRLDIKDGPFIGLTFGMSF